LIKTQQSQAAAPKAAAFWRWNVKSHREARIAGLSLAGIYVVCLLLSAIGMT
jgi:hypothetical protein